MAEVDGLVVVDLDGVVWLAGEPLPGAPAALGALRAAGAEVLFLTNNSSRSVGEYAAALARAGVDAQADEIVTSAVVAGDHLAAVLAPGARILACAGSGVVEALSERGFSVVDEWPCDAVVVGWHAEFDFGALTRASTAVRNGARFVATNLDPTYPAPGGLLPGNGALVAAVATAAGAEPEVVGKPRRATVEVVSARAGNRPGVVVGDRSSTDGALAAALGWPFVLVRSDVSTTERDQGIRPAVEADALSAVVDDVLRLLTRP